MILFRPTLKVALLALSFWLWPGDGVRAHPHAWVDVKIEVRFDAEGRVEALRQVWLFDEFYTAFATHGVAGKGKVPEQVQLDALMLENLTNLAEFDYFTWVKIGEEKVKFRPVDDATTRMVGARLEMTFVLEFTEPAAAPVTYAVYDPSYYIEMLHDKDPGAIRLANAPDRCRHQMTQPNPTMEMIMTAAALDRSQTGGDGLGIMFAEQVSIRCD